jgi:glutamate synthase domain-containing protein 2
MTKSTRPQQQAKTRIGPGALAGAARRYFVLLASLVATIAGIALVFVSYWWLILVGIALPMLVLSLRDLFQRQFTLPRNYPGAAWIRWLAYDLRPYLRQYIVEGDLEGQPYSFEARNLVYARARGHRDTHPFGSDRSMGEAGYHWVSHSIAPCAEPDTDPRVAVGNEQTSRPYDASILNISAMSFGSLSGRAIEALNAGASEGCFYQDTGEGGLSKYHLKNGGDLVWEIGSGYFGCRDSDGRFDAAQFQERAQHDAVKMTEIKLSQGAKPGHGGVLPGAKVTEEIAAVRLVEPWQDCVSPRHHSAFSTPVEMLEFAATMRELSGGKPVGIKLCVGQPHEVMAIMKAMLLTEVYLDFIVVDGAEGGTGAAPLELSDWVGMPLNEGLVLVRNALVGAGLRERVRLVASGKVYSGMGLARNLALGADWCNAARAFMFSVGCIQAKRCHLGTCPTGVTTQDPLRQRGLVVDVQARRAARYHAKTVEALTDIVAATGLRHPRDLHPHHITARIDSARSRSMDNVHVFLRDRALLDAPDETPYAQWWDAANPGSFAPLFDLHNGSNLR